MWCTCTKAPVGFKERAPGEIWVCSRCNEPTIQNFSRLTAMLGPNDAICLLSDHGRRDGVHELRWDTKSGRKTTLVFLPYPMKVGMEYQSSLLHELWKKLDDEVNIIQTPGDYIQNAEGRTNSRIRARMLAEVLHTLMQPFYKSPDDVVREAMARYQHRKSGTEHETPGLGEKIWDPNARWDGTPYGKPAPAKKSKRTGKSIPPSSLNSVREGVRSGMFTVAQIAQMYDVSAEEVKEQLGIA